MNSVSFILKIVKPTEVLEELEETTYRDELEDLFCDNKPNNSTPSNQDCKIFNYCNGHGICIDGKCHCFEGWTSYDCSQSKILL